MLRPALLGALGLSLSLSPLAAFASAGYQSDIPNGLAVGCVACHLANNDPGLNLFGQAVSATKRSGLPHWPSLFELDSDADGQTNGQELGDPCGTWRKGQPAPRTTNISNPGRVGSTSTTPDVPACAPVDAGVRDLGSPDLGAPDLGTPDAGPRDLGGPDAGVVPVRDAGATDAGEAPDAGGCRCVSGAERSGSGLVLLLLGGALWTRRRLRAQFAG